MNEQITFWSTKKIKIKELNDWPHNPRTISKKEFERLVDDIKSEGFHNRILVDVDGGGSRKPNTIIGGHNRKKALYSLGLKPDDEIEVYYNPKPLTEYQFKKLNYKDNRNYGEYNYEMLANNYEIEDLINWGEDMNKFKIEDDVIVEENVKESLPGNVCATCPFKESL